MGQVRRPRRDNGDLVTSDVGYWPPEACPALRAVADLGGYAERLDRCQQLGGVPRRRYSRDKVANDCCTRSSVLRQGRSGFVRGGWYARCEWASIVKTTLEFLMP